MRVFPGSVFYEPADLGFNATPVGAGLDVNGSIIPAAILTRGQQFVMHLNASAAVLSLNVRINLFREDGQTALLPANQNFWTSLSVADAWLSYTLGGTAATTAGTGAANASAPVLIWPYVRFNVSNSSAASTNVTLRLCVGTI